MTKWKNQQQVEILCALIQRHQSWRAVTAGTLVKRSKEMLDMVDDAPDDEEPKTVRPKFGSAPVGFEA